MWAEEGRVYITRTMSGAAMTHTHHVAGAPRGAVLYEVVIEAVPLVVAGLRALEVQVQGIRITPRDCRVETMDGFPTFDGERWFRDPESGRYTRVLAELPEADIAALRLLDIPVHITCYARDERPESFDGQRHGRTW